MFIKQETIRPSADHQQTCVTIIMKFQDNAGRIRKQ